MTKARKMISDTRKALQTLIFNIYYKKRIRKKIVMIPGKCFNLNSTNALLITIHLITNHLLPVLVLVFHLVDYR